MYFELFDVSITLCRSFNMTPFELFKQDVEEVIMLINYFIEKGETTPSQNSQNSSKKEERIKVNDKTATGGWY